MRKLNSIEKANYINDRYKEYLRSSFHFETTKMQELFEKSLEKETLFRGPYVNLILPFQRGKTIKNLVDEGTLCKSFLKLNNTHQNRPLYLHQEEAIRKIAQNRSVVVTTGTGSGKTECFLYPILNEILSEIENGNDDIGVRAIFLYPMNALVNDQINRLRDILEETPEVTFGFFTGDTEEKVSKNYRDNKRNNGEKVLDNEMVSREEIRNHPPHLLFTNYSMLEHLLIRPNDCSIFSESHLNNWKYVVLDEAHSYHGSLGIEMAMLMRRLTSLAHKKPNFILTSATLGKEGESEEEIVKFANRLTSAEFSVNDIIFSKRIPMDKTRIKFKVDSQDYLKLKGNLKNESIISEVCAKYGVQSTGKVNEKIYNLLICDENVLHLYNLIKEGPLSFSEIKNQFFGIVTDIELIALIDLINFAEKNGIGIFDLKYHSFVRPISGAYVTLGDNSELSLMKTRTIKGQRAFELGNCRFCNTPYVIGKIRRNTKDGLEYLFQNDDTDIYENYGDNEKVKIDYFLLNPHLESNDFDSQSEEISEQLEEYEVCTTCGCISSKENLNAVHCNCENSKKVTLYKVVQNNKDKTFKSYNNITKCPCCGHESNSGIVKNLSMGKDEGTALIAQILYEAIDEGDLKQTVNTGKLRLGSLKKPKMVQEEPKIKQFLSFSDNRQQASFAATFMDANHTRLLRKRLIWKIIEDNGFKNIDVDHLISRLTLLIKQNNLFNNKLSAEKNAWISTLVDLLKVDGVFDGEGLGLYYFDLNLDDLEMQISDEDVNEELGKYGLQKEDFFTLIKIIFDVFKTSSAIDYTISPLTMDERKEYLDYRRFDNFIAYKNESKLKNIKSLLPIKNKSNKYVDLVQQICNCKLDEACEILEVMFNLLIQYSDRCADAEKPFIKHSKQEAYQMNVSRYVLKNYKTSKFYQCSKCGKVTPYNIHDKCPSKGCNGILKEIDPDNIFEKNYYRKEYMNKKIERIVIEEHTAQLERKKAREYQERFKNKDINILSCSTTFEMGVDIGDLETVFMRNVPPTPANYVQRAGRAGRRKDSSAFVLTYCGTSSHDYTYFLNPNDMITGVVKPPYFNILNRKIIKRHLMAYCLGEFFRAYPEYYKSVNRFVFEDGKDNFIRYVKNNSKKIIDHVDNKIIPESDFAEFHDLRWFDSIDDETEKLNIFIDSIQKIEQEYKEGLEEAIAEEEYKDANYFSHQIDVLHKSLMIDMLSKYCVIPKYGFPVDVVELEVYDDQGHRDFTYDLNRDLKIAISEYAPDSEVIVDKKKYTSKYITLPKEKELDKNYFFECENCKKINVSKNPYSLESCKYCNYPHEGRSKHYFIQPVLGFKTGKTKESSHMKPKRSYSGDIKYLGGGIKTEPLNINDNIMLESSRDDELLVMNYSSFYMCPVCGYSEIEKNNNVPSSIEKQHNNYRQFQCNNEKLDLVRLGHRFKTDVVRIKIKQLSTEVESAYAKAISFLYALLEGISSGLEIDRNDIDGIVEMNTDSMSYDLLLFDNVPGGAGHVRRLIDKESIKISLKSALYKVSQNCCDENTSCYNCLRNFKNQHYHEMMKRVYAKELITYTLEHID